MKVIIILLLLLLSLFISALFFDASPWHEMRKNEVFTLLLHIKKSFLSHLTISLMLSLTHSLMPSFVKVTSPRRYRLNWSTNEFSY